VIASVVQLPYFVCTCVLGGFALWGWRRSGTTGPLVIVIACGVRVLGHVAYVWQMARLYRGGATSYAQTAMVLGAFESTGGLIADVLIIVGVALLLRRLPPKAKATAR
jgi:hypothetical protein